MMKSPNNDDQDGCLFRAVFNATHAIHCPECRDLFLEALREELRMEGIGKLIWYDVEKKKLFSS